MPQSILKLWIYRFTSCFHGVSSIIVKSSTLTVKVRPATFERKKKKKGKIFGFHCRCPAIVTLAASPCGASSGGRPSRRSWLAWKSMMFRTGSRLVVAVELLRPLEPGRVSSCSPELMIGGIGCDGSEGGRAGEASVDGPSLVVPTACPGSATGFLPLVAEVRRWWTDTFLDDSASVRRRSDSDFLGRPRFRGGSTVLDGMES